MSYSDTSSEIKPAFTSSSEDEVPIEYTGHEKKTRRQSIKKSFESFRNDVDPEGYTQTEIFGDLGLDEIEMKRVDTRRTIYSELATRIPHADIEKGLEFEQELQLPVDNEGLDFEDIDPELITFKGTNDPEDPRNWSLASKAYVIVFASLYTLLPPMSSSILSPALSSLSEEFNITSSVVSAMVVSIQILAWAFGPLVIAPLSEDDRLGRKTVLDASCWLSLFFNLGCAFSQNTTQMLVCRFFSGLFNSSALNVSPAVVSDLFDAKARNVSLAGVALLPLLGPVLAPVIGGYVVENMHWRWVLYVLCMFNGALAIVGTIFYRESYAPTLLRQKAKKLRKATGNQNLHTFYEIANGETTFDKMKLTVTRPLKLLFTHPTVIGLGSFMAFIYGFMYLMIVTFPTIYGEIYGFDKGTVGLMYLPMGIGFVIGVLFWTVVLQKVYQHLTKKNGGVAKPEFRLPCLIVNTGCLIPMSLLIFGWSVEYRAHWVVPSIGSAIFAFSFCCVFQALQNVLIDSIKFAASAVAAAAVFRSFFGFSFPLFANIMYAKMGYGWANTMFAIIALILGLPFPIILFKYGERIRTSANERMEREQARRNERNLKRLQQRTEKN